jgi:endonuclease/exonuclease/phosphatase family metal-dependent hydrolase
MRIRVATLNVWALPGPFGHQVRQRMRAIGAKLSTLGLDAVALQEVWTAEARGILLRAGREAGLVHAWHNDTALGGSGLMILSRLPIEAVRFERFLLPGRPQRIDHPDYYGGKGFARVRLATTAGTVTLVDTHLHARYGSDVAHEYVAYRIGEIVQIATRMAVAREPLIAAGDFNFRKGDPEYRVLTGLARLRDVAAELGHPEPTVFRGNPFRTGHRKPDRRVDFLFVRDGRQLGVHAHETRRIFDEVFELGGRPASYSDHAGVLAELEIARTSPASPPTFDPEAASLASRLLADGRSLAERRRRGDRAVAGAGFGMALLAAAGVRSRSVTRRRLLRRGLEGAGILALTPTVGLSILSELFVPDELRAFDKLAALLDRARSGATDLLT